MRQPTVTSGSNNGKKLHGKFSARVPRLFHVKNFSLSHPLPAQFSRFHFHDKTAGCFIASTTVAAQQNESIINEKSRND